ncbi:hypothetical protein GWK48_10970 [Metallosphaera tengchongensis]|uniref:Uncharacterized protein n=1 Tax=Metallosphaera tengchongensis TaxID=1532350 RepID=A0A6N0NVC9_9CREN|nr:hypothetical protein GWK48_10970 [Metallosphaera tengchongensis]
MALTYGQPQEYEELEPISSAILEGSLHAVTVWSSPRWAQLRKLRNLGDASSRLYNGVNYERGQQSFQQMGVELKGTWEKYTGIQ